jgi:capsule polysaccharide export protein KpsE/RkpR
MKKPGNMAAAAAVLALVAGLLAGGCKDREKEELNRQIQQQITIIETEMNAVEAHQEKMRGMIKQMQSELDAMQEELNKEAPRVHAAGSALGYLKELSTFGFGESAASETLREPAWSLTNVLWIGLFLLIIWLLYRYMLKGRAKQ